MYIYIYYNPHICVCVNMCDLAHWVVHWRIDCRGVGVNWRPVDLSIAVPPNVSLKLLHQAALEDCISFAKSTDTSSRHQLYVQYIYMWLYIYDYYYYIYMIIYICILLHISLYLSLSLSTSVIAWLVGWFIATLWLPRLWCELATRRYLQLWRPKNSRVHQHTMIKVHDVVSYLYIYVYI